MTLTMLGRAAAPTNGMVTMAGAGEDLDLARRPARAKLENRVMPNLARRNLLLNMKMTMITTMVMTIGGMV